MPGKLNQYWSEKHGDISSPTEPYEPFLTGRFCLTQATCGKILKWYWWDSKSRESTWTNMDCECVNSNFKFASDESSSFYSTVCYRGDMIKLPYNPRGFVIRLSLDLSFLEHCIGSRSILHNHVRKIYSQSTRLWVGSCGQAATFFRCVSMKAPIKFQSAPPNE